MILAYLPTKHVFVGLTKSFVVEVAGSNIRVNSIHPSPVNTRMMRSLEEGLGFEQADSAQTIPLGRYGEAMDIANVALFLASDESTFVSGAQYRVDGGMAAL